MLHKLHCGSYILDLRKTCIMGILNLTPDSFYNASHVYSIDTAVEYAQKMIKDGADIIDIGGESTRPGSKPVSEKEELKRVVPVVERLIHECSVPTSLDTSKPKVAETCLKLGVHMINDITGLTNNHMRKIVAEYSVPVVMMHMLGSPKTMQEKPIYTDVIAEIKDFFTQQINQGYSCGIKEIIIDPGIGFGKTLNHNLEIFRRLTEFQEFDCPILIGASRKSFIGSITGLPVEKRLEGSLAAAVVACMQGVHIIRVHDVWETKQAVEIVDAIRGV